MPANQTQGGQSFEQDISRIAKLRRMCDFKMEPYDVSFLIGFIDRLWREYSRSNDESERLRAVAAYAEHRNDCFWWSPTRECTCGLFRAQGITASAAKVTQ